MEKPLLKYRGAFDDLYYKLFVIEYNISYKEYIMKKNKKTKSLTEQIGLRLPVLPSKVVPDKKKESDKKKCRKGFDND